MAHISFQFMLMLLIHWAEACILLKKKSLRVLVGKPEGDNLEDPDINGRIILI